MLSISRSVAVCVAATAVVAFGVAPAVGAVLDPGDPMVAAVSSQARRAEASRVTPAPVPPPAPADAATDVVRLTNAERAARGLPALVIDPAMAQVALAHSLDQIAMGRMSHTGSDGTSVWDRLTRAGVVWGACAENVAWGHPTAATVVDGWMASPSHRVNMLGSYTRIGVGMAKDPDGHPVWTMVLAN